MGAFEKTLEVYREANRDHVGNIEDQERLRSLYLQRAWADKKCAELAVGETEREMATIQWMEELGEWFRKNIMEFPSEPGKESRKDRLLSLFEDDPALRLWRNWTRSLCALATKTISS